jgi:hypothetical protein
MEGPWQPPSCPYALRQTHGYLHIHDADCQPLHPGDDYYEQVRAELGHGLPWLLGMFGYTKRALDRAIQQAKDSYDR